MLIILAELATNIAHIQNFLAIITKWYMRALAKITRSSKKREYVQKLRFIVENMTKYRNYPQFYHIFIQLAANITHY